MSNHEWIQPGISVLYTPGWRDGRLSTKSFAGIVAAKPFLLGDPKSRNWVVRLEQMDSEFIKEFGRNCISCVNVDFIREVP